MDALKLAVNCGADAVYFGAASFHARRAAQNPIILQEAVNYCHLFGVKAYLALNINIKEKEFDEVVSLVSEAYSAKIDAFIVTDLGILSILKKHAAGVPLHASTQLGICAKEGAEFLNRLGFSRIILAREAGLKEISEIKEMGLEVEYFVHGALCVAFSGSCLLSSVMGECSGNRGLCKQPCRLPYTLKVGKTAKLEGYCLSPKDQCLINRLEELKNAGVDSLKIEGRLKRDAYQGGVTEIYRRALDGKSECEDRSKLKRLFNRGDFSEGYAFDQKNNLICADVQGNIGESIGIIDKVQAGRAFFNAISEINDGDGFKILRKGKEVDAGLQDLKKEGKRSYSAYANGLMVGDEIRITTDAQLNREIFNMHKKIMIDIKCQFLLGKEAKVEVFWQNLVVCAKGAVLNAAKNAPLSADDIVTAISKLGDTPFKIGKIEVETDGVFLQKSAINALRREVCDSLTRQIIEKNTPNYDISLSNNENNLLQESNKIDQNAIFVQVSTLEQAIKIPRQPSTFVVFAPENYQKEEIGDFVQKFKAQNSTCPVFLFSPAIMMSHEMRVLEQIFPLVDGVIANNLSVVWAAILAKKQVICGSSLNIMNKNNPLIALTNGYLVSVELNQREAAEFKDGIIYAYGSLPVMYFKHCPKQTCGISCKKCQKMDKITLNDQKYEYTILRSEFEGACQFRLLNPVNADFGKFARGRNLYLDFSRIKPEEVDRLFEDYYNGTRESMGEYTLLHTKRGVL